MHALRTSVHTAIAGILVPVHARALKTTTKSIKTA